jgi:signal transduction histidine kinase/CheY-like chemotaxis protein
MKKGAAGRAVKARKGRDGETTGGGHGVHDLAKIPSENPNPILRITGTGRALFVNPAARELKGLFIGRKGDTLSRPLTRAASGAVRSGRTTEADFASGDRVFSFAFSPVPGESYINAYGRDVTEERQALRETHDLAKFPAENPNAILRVTRTGGVLFTNPAGRSIRGLLVGRKRDMIAAPLARAAGEVARAHRPKPVEFCSGGRTFELLFAPVRGEAYINVYGRDVTEEKRALRETLDLARFPSENPNPVLRADRTGRVVYSNDASHAVPGLLTGRKRDGLAPKIAVHARAVFRTHNNKVVEFASGNRWYAITIAAFKGAAYVNIYGRDMTAERLAKDELIRANETLEERVRERTASVNLLQNIVIAANEATGVQDAIRICLDEVCRYTGWPAGHAYLAAGDGSGEVVATDIWHLDKPGRFKAMRAATEGARFAPGQGLPGRVLKSKRPAWIVDVTKDKNFYRATQTSRVGVKSAMAFPVMAGSEVAGVLEFFSTEKVPRNEEILTVMGHIGTQLGRVAERKRAEKAVRKSNARTEQARGRLLDAIEAISEGFALFGADDRLVICNSNYRDMYIGADVDVVEGVPYQDILRSAVRAGMIGGVSDADQDWFESRLAKHRNPTGPYEQQRGDGQWLKISERRTQDSGIVGVFSNITELKHREKELGELVDRLAEMRDAAKGASHAKSQFLANMSHELRTPLNAVIGITEMLQEDAEDLGQDDFIEPLQRISRAGKHLLQLINGVLDLSKIEAGKLDLYLEDFDVNTLMSDLVVTVQPLVENNRNRLVLNCADDAGGMHADVTRVRQILFNLLSNACKFTENGEIVVDVEVARRDAGDEMIFRVRDSGIGMTPEQLDKLFREFSQADSSTTRKYGGTGLGLAISQRLCHLMGGDITVESTPGEGTTFTAHLPRNIVPPAGMSAEDDAGEEQPLAARPAGERHTRSNTVLVVDDDANVRDVMRRFLAKEGFDVMTAEDGEEAIRLAQEVDPLMITLDVLMPGMDGWEVLQRLKGDPQLCGIPVVMLTILEEKGRGYALGASDYMTKPVDRGRLRTILERYRADGKERRVLVVEDDEPTRALMRRMLIGEGWQVDEAEHGIAALARIGERTPDLILLDLIMPEMDGFEFLAELRRDPDKRRIPVVVVTAADLTEDDRRRLSGGVEHVLQKASYDSNELLAELSELVALYARAGAPGDEGLPK